MGPGWEGRGGKRVRRVEEGQSSALDSYMLFFCGFFWARFTGVNRWYTGFVMMLVGLGLVGIAMLLGG